MLRRMFCKLGATGLASMAISKKISALEKVASAPAKKWAIVFGSKCGSTKEYAGFINEGLGGIAEVIDIEKTTPKTDDYDFFIIGGWRNGNDVMPQKIPSFVNDNKSVLNNKVKGMFVVLGNQGKPTLKPEMTTFLNNKLIIPSGAKDAAGKIFFGRYDPDCGKLGGTSYNNVNKDDGVAFGQKILSENQTGIFKSSSSMNRIADLYCSSGFFGRSSTVNYTIPVSGHVELFVCSIHGQKVATMVSQYQNAGSYRVPLSGKNLAPGHYICRLEAAGILKTISATITQ